MSSYLSAIFPRARALISKPCLNASRPFTSIYLSRRIPSTPLNAYLPTKSTLPPSPSSNLRPSKPPTTLPTTQTRHATSNYTPKPTSTGSTKKSLRQRPDPRITQLRYHLLHPLSLTPRPLRLSRLRSLRHWTIHRAHLLHRRQRLDRTERVLERQYNSMRDACEALRTLPGDEGRLYRKAMLKVGVFGTHGGNGGRGDARERDGGWPIEAARAQTEWPGRGVDAGWNVGWRR